VVCTDDDETEEEDNVDSETLWAVAVAQPIVDPEGDLILEVVDPSSPVPLHLEGHYAEEGIDGTTAATEFVASPETEEPKGITNLVNAALGDDSLQRDASWDEDARHSSSPLPPVPTSGLQLGFDRQKAQDEQLDSHLHTKGEAELTGFESIAILPPVIFFQRADGSTRVRYAVDVLTVQDQKYVRLDETHFLYAVKVDPQFLSEHVGNRTMRQAQYAHWQGDRNGGRPEILFELYPKGQYDYSPATGRRKKAPHEFYPQCDEHGRVLLNFFDRPLKNSHVIPFAISTEIEGWEMEAICRMDPDICHQDFLDRMLPDSALNGKTRPTKGTLNHRRRRDRMKMRILPWPLPRQLSYSDQQVVKELDASQVENNTTRLLQDLSKEDIEIQEAIMYGGHFERSGPNKALNDRARLEQMKVNLRLVRTKFDEGSEEVRMMKQRIVGILKKTGVDSRDLGEWDA
jgi:hypothetical protein